MTPVRRRARSRTTGTTARWKYIRVSPLEAIRHTAFKAFILINAHEVSNNRIIEFVTRHSWIYTWVTLKFWLVLPLALAGLVDRRWPAPTEVSVVDLCRRVFGNHDPVLHQRTLPNAVRGRSHHLCCFGGCRLVPMAEAEAARPAIRWDRGRIGRRCPRGGSGGATSPSPPGDRRPGFLQRGRSLPWLTAIFPPPRVGIRRPSTSSRATVTQPSTWLRSTPGCSPTRRKSSRSLSRSNQSVRRISASDVSSDSPCVPSERCDEGVEHLRFVAMRSPGSEEAQRELETALSQD